ncbi:unnamed protein product, partial [Staurois parvus]
MSCQSAPADPDTQEEVRGDLPKARRYLLLSRKQVSLWRFSSHLL